MFRALSEINKREELESPGKEEQENQNIAKLDKEIEAMIEDTPDEKRETNNNEQSEQKSRDYRSREGYSREKKRVDNRSAEGSSEYSHSGVYSL